MSVARYLWFYVRLFVAIYGFWILLMAAPWLTRFDGPAWVAPLLLGIVLVFWNEQHTIVLRWLRARPGQTFLEIYPRAAILDH